MENPDKNYIDIVRYKKGGRKFGFFAVRDERVRVGRIGFPRWTCQVLPQTIKLVRQMTSLSAKDGVDSGAFFHGLDPMQSLITDYNEPLMRLAYR